MTAEKRPRLWTEEQQEKRRAAKRAYYYRNRELLQAKAREYNNSAAGRERRKKWREANPDRHLASIAKWKRANPEKVRGYARKKGPVKDVEKERARTREWHRKSREENPEANRARVRIWYWNNRSRALARGKINRKRIRDVNQATDFASTINNLNQLVEKLADTTT